MRMVQSPHGDYCESCVPPWLGAHEMFTVQTDDVVEEYPFCAVCGRRHEYMLLSPVGERYQRELVGPRRGDVLVTHAGPANALREVSLVEDGIVAVFAPDQFDDLRQWVERYCRQHPTAFVWELEDEGVATLTGAWRTTRNRLERCVFVNGHG